MLKYSKKIPQKMQKMYKSRGEATISRRGGGAKPRMHTLLLARMHYVIKYFWLLMWHLLELMRK